MLTQHIISPVLLVFELSVTSSDHMSLTHGFAKHCFGLRTLFGFICHLHMISPSAALAFEHCSDSYVTDTCDSAKHCFGLRTLFGFICHFTYDSPRTAWSSNHWFGLINSQVTVLIDNHIDIKVLI